jgi:hypothetical protein
MPGWRETDEMEGRLRGGADRSMAGEERSMPGWRETETIKATLNESGFVGD